MSAAHLNKNCWKANKATMPGMITVVFPVLVAKDWSFSMVKDMIQVWHLQIEGLSMIEWNPIVLQVSVN